MTKEYSTPPPSLTHKAMFDSLEFISVFFFFLLYFYNNVFYFLHLNLFDLFVVVFFIYLFSFTIMFFFFFFTIVEYFFASVKRFIRNSIPRTMSIFYRICFKQKKKN